MDKKKLAEKKKEAKDTVMMPEQTKAKRKELFPHGHKDCFECEQFVRETQAEISFKAGLKHGIWLFAWWKNGVQYVGTGGRTLQEAYKEVGIERIEDANLTNRTYNALKRAGYNYLDELLGSEDKYIRNIGIKGGDEIRAKLN